MNEKNKNMKIYSFSGLVISCLLSIWMITGCKHSSPTVRKSITIDKDWVTIADDTDSLAYQGFENPDFVTKDWLSVDVPHNWDDYGGYRRKMHGNRHGYAWYRKTLNINNDWNQKEIFLWFEGVGSYATVWVNGVKVGHHAGGRTSFTLNITKAVRFGQENVIAVRADHPADIRDLPWVCGGCSTEWGFSEGSQPMGIFRPVHIVASNGVRVEPFGVHAWNDTTITKESATVHVTVEAKNYKKKETEISVSTKLIDDKGGVVATSKLKGVSLAPGEGKVFDMPDMVVKNPSLWNPDAPYLYSVETSIYKDGQLEDLVSEPFGIRKIKWDIFGDKPTNRFYINDKPVFINGTAEYEHLFGQSHAFSDEQVQTHIDMFMAMGYNSFRDAHQPHNLRYQKAWEENGILWWTQMAAHIWFDNPAFKKNFKNLLRDWVKERRNNPSVILWGLENESTLPEAFAKECSDIIRELDPTTSSQRLVTTCNGGSGTDWNVIQNWSGTYGGKPENYGEELKTQLLNGEYGAWRSIDLHSEGEFDAKGVLSEDRMCLLMESKIRLAESVADSCCGQYHWLLNSHDNPGRIQGGEGLRDLDRVGPVNYKGTVTIWDEPLDVFYMFRSNYADKHKQPMVYLVSHTWPDRWTEPGIKDGIRVFSNCDEVELFNGYQKNSLGKKKRRGIGTHFVFNQVNIQTNLLYVVGYTNGKKVAEDYIVLHHLPKDPDLDKLAGDVVPLLESDPKWYPIYRVNCGGPEYIDKQGNVWSADVALKDNASWGSVSWTNDYEGLPAFYGSQRQTYDPIKGTLDWPLMQSFRYGRHKLSYHFPVPDGKYKVDLFFTEPWYGTGGGLDCTGWRIFDVAVNNERVIENLDIWKEVGHDALLKKSVVVDVKDGAVNISFPKVLSSQAVISAIAVYSGNEGVQPAQASLPLITDLKVLQDNGAKWKVESWLNTGDNQFVDKAQTFVTLPAELYGAEWIKASSVIKGGKKPVASFMLTEDADIYVGVDSKLVILPTWLKGFLPSDKSFKAHAQHEKTYILYQKRYHKGDQVELYPAADSKNSDMYFVGAVAATSLDKAIDLRKTVTYQAEDGKRWGGAKETEFMKKTCVKLPGKSGSIGFEFKVGLASKYGLQFRYMNMSGTPVDLDVEILANDNRLMWSGTWQLPSAPIKWKSFRTDTQTTINAGTYTIKMTPKSNADIYFDWVKVQ